MKAFRLQWIRRSQFPNMKKISKFTIINLDTVKHQWRFCLILMMVPMKLKILPMMLKKVLPYGVI
uniref:Uncharacterized protein n=1 Tax=Helianthus annuus TaxID=4232 RepID=A0A251SKJ2_HELAN